MIIFFLLLISLNNSLAANNNKDSLEILFLDTTFTDTTYIDTTNNDTTYTNINKIRKTTSSNLKQNYPNPFQSITNIKYELQKESIVKIEIFDLLGKTQAILVNE